MSERLKELEIEERFAELNVIITGLPGSGKTSLINSLSVKLNYISLGDITRAELTADSQIGNAIRTGFQTLEPWPANFVISIVTPHLIRARNEGRGFILDGVPRKASEAVALTQWTQANELPIDPLLGLQIEPRIALERIAMRDNAGRLETIGHYETRMRVYLAEEEEMLRIMREAAKESLIINTDNNPPGLAKSL